MIYKVKIWDGLKKRYPSLKNIEFADVCPASSTIQIDFFLFFVLFCFCFCCIYLFIYLGHTNNYNTLHLQFITINQNYQIDSLIGLDYI